MLKYLITVYLDDGSLNCSIASEAQARIMVALLISHESVRRVTLHRETKAGLIIMIDLDERARL